MINWAKLRWQENVREVIDPNTKRLLLEVRENIIQVSSKSVPIDCTAIGVDPGRNFGIAMAEKKGEATWLRTLHGNLHVNQDWHYVRDGIFAIRLVQQVLQNFMPAPACAIGIEGAAHSTSPGQANLAYIRMGLFVGFHNAYGDKVELVPINTARKSATGKGTVSMGDLLPNMNLNAADALGVALHMAGYRGVWLDDA
jgi:hypothetical protein